MEKVAQVTQLMNWGGTLGWAVAIAGGFAVLCALFVLFGSLLKAPSKVVRFFAMACLLLSLTTSGIGLACTVLGRQTTAKATVGKRPSQVERIERQGFIEARSGVTLAVPLAAPPIFLALIGLFVASRRRWSEDHDEPPPGLTFAMVLLLLDLAGVAGAVWMYRQPVPGKELEEDGWLVRELTDALDVKEWDKCLTTKWVLKFGSAAQGMGAHADNQKRCIEHFASEGKPEDLKALAAVGWLDDPKMKALIAEKLAGGGQPVAKAPEPAAAAGAGAAAPVAGAGAAAPAPPSPAADIAEVQAKARACFDKAAKKKPKLTVATSFALEISAQGKVVAAKDVGKGKPDAVRKCALASTKGLKLKAGDARKLEVPLSFP